MTNVSLQRESLLIDAIDSAIILLDQNNHIMHANPSACAALAQSHQQLINQPIHNYLILNEQHTDNIKVLTVKPTQPSTTNTNTVCGDHAKKIHLPGGSLGFATTAIIWHPLHNYTHSKNQVTGLPDNTALKQHLSPLLTQMTQNTPHTLIYMTLNTQTADRKLTDHPKQLNLLMSDIAALLSPNIRQRDLLAHPEQNAFALLLRGCDLKHAEPIAQKLLDEINAYHEDYPDIHLPSWQVCTSIIPLARTQTPEETLLLAHQTSLSACNQKEKIILLNQGDWESE